MKFKSINQPILRSLFEAFLIFLSLYAAFLLEAERSRDFERELLIGKLEVMLDEISHDSIKYHDFYEDVDSTGFSNVWEDVYYDSLALDLMVHGEVDSVFKLFKSELIISFWNVSWTAEPPTYESILNNYSHLLHDHTLHGLDLYFHQRRFLNDLNSQSIESRERLMNDLSDKFFIMDPFIRTEDKIRVVNSPLFKNTVSHSFLLRKDVLVKAKELTPFIPQITKLIKDELVRQREQI